jgi:predicted RNA-binding Zn-ribbon protein involved in translation (DUF1610 family)
MAAAIYVDTATATKHPCPASSLRGVLHFQGLRLSPAGDECPADTWHPAMLSQDRRYPRQGRYAAKPLIPRLLGYSILSMSWKRPFTAGLNISICCAKQQGQQWAAMPRGADLATLLTVVAHQDTIGPKLAVKRCWSCAAASSKADTRLLIQPDATLCLVFIKRSKSNTTQRTRYKAGNWKQLEILWILFALGVAVLYFYLKSPSVIGAAGERRVNATLSRKLDERDYTLIEDLTLPTLEGTTQIDHIVLSRFGVFVIETKNMSGWIFGGESQALWTQVMRRHKSQFQNPLRQNYLHVRVVQDLLGIRLDQLENLVVFVGSAEPKTEMPWNVFWSRGDLYNYVASQRTVRFTDAEVREFAHKLRNSTLQASKEQRRAHIQHVKEKVSQKETDLTVCPRCGEKMIERTSRKTGQTFFGCSRYPKCQGTRKVK